MYLVLCKAGCSKQLTKSHLVNEASNDCPLLDSWLKSQQLKQIPITLPLQSNDHSLWGPSYCSKSQLSSLVLCIYSRVSSALCRVCQVHFWFLDSIWCNSSFCGNTHNSHLLGILQFSQLISFGCVGFCSSLVAVSSIGIMFGIMSYHHCPITTVFQYHAFQFSSFQFGMYRQWCSCNFVDNGFGFTICYGGRLVGVQFGGIDTFCCGWLGCVGVQFNCRNFVSSFSFSSSFSAMQERRTTFSHSDQDLPTLLPLLLLSFLSLIRHSSTSCKSSEESCH